MKQAVADKLWEQLTAQVRQDEESPTSTSSADRPLWSEAERARITKLSEPPPPPAVVVEDYVARLFGEIIEQSADSIWTNAERVKIRPMLENPPRPEPIGSDGEERRGFVRRCSHERVVGGCIYIPLTTHQTTGQQGQRR